MHVLVLGGTGEARDLAATLAARPGLRVTLSLAGRTRAPILPACTVRVGGFGGAEGLAAWVRNEGVDVLVDATHPFARVISPNAERAAAHAAIPLIVLERPPWRARPGDHWIRVSDMARAAEALGAERRRVFLAVGRQEIAAFRTVPQHAYVVRSVEPARLEDLPSGAETILARGPFCEADERALLAEHRIEVVVTKNSGGDATYGKIAAARSLELPVVIVDRQPRPDAAETVAQALARFDHVATSAAKRGV